MVQFLHKDIDLVWSVYMKNKEPYSSIEHLPVDVGLHALVLLP